MASLLGAALPPVDEGLLFQSDLDLTALLDGTAGAFDNLDDLQQLAFPADSPTAVVVGPGGSLTWGSSPAPDSGMAVPDSEESVEHPQASERPASKAKSKAEAQKERIRAKNRRAQNKYRLKKKSEAAEAGAAYEEAASELAALRLEHASLLETNAAMERTLGVRDSAVAILEEGREVGDILVRGCKIMSFLQLGCKDAQRDCTPASEAGGDCDDPRAPAAPAISLSDVASIKRTTPEAVAARYRDIVLRMRDALGALREVEAAPGGAAPDAVRAAEDRLVSVLSESRLLCFEQAVAKPENLQRLMATSAAQGAGAGEGAGGPEAQPQHLARYAAIARMLGLSAEQRARLAVPRREFEAEMGAVLAERGAVLARLRGVAVPGALAGGLAGVTAEWISANDAASEMSASLAREHRAAMRFLAATFGQVLTMRQKAATFVAAWPAFPDVYALAAAACAEAEVLPGGGDGPR